MNRLKDLLLKSRHAIAFTGAGISVESGIPPFRGENGIWNKYDHNMLDIAFFHRNPEKSWTVVKEVFYEFFGYAKPNPAHLMLANLEKAGIIKAVVTQNIDNLHQKAGSKAVIEYHGNSQNLVCTKCDFRTHVNENLLQHVPVTCPECGALVKPDFVFFGEGIPPQAHFLSLEHARQCDLIIVIGALGEVYPAANIPIEAKRNGATVVEINPEKTNYTDYITDIYYPQKAGEAFAELSELMQI